MMLPISHCVCVQALPPFLVGSEDDNTKFCLPCDWRSFENIAVAVEVVVVEEEVVVVVVEEEEEEVEVAVAVVVVAVLLYN